MAELVKIENTEMAIKEYNGMRVVTMKDIDRVHHKKSDTAKKSFQKYKSHFILGTDYFEITRKELGERYSPNEKIVGNPNIKTYLFTESGYLMIVKVFTDDLAWEVQRQLVNSYFAVKNKMETAEPKIEDCNYHVSMTPVPKTPTWYARNQRRIERIVQAIHGKKSQLYHRILLFVGEEYDLDEAAAIYEQEKGYPPRYSMDMISYFPELSECADKYLECAEKSLKESGKL